MLTQLYIHFFVALAGLVSFLSPCVLPLVPPYLGYLGGTTIEQIGSKDGIDAHLWRRVVLASVLFVLGFTTVFVGLGVVTALTGSHEPAQALAGHVGARPGGYHRPRSLDHPSSPGPVRGQRPGAVEPAVPDEG